MPQIPVYNAQITPQGEIERHHELANPDDFGAQIGQGVQRLGSAIGDVAGAESQHLTEQDATNTHVFMAQARESWTQTLQDRANQAQPGDDTFHTQLTGDMSDWFAKNNPTTTPAGGRLYKAMTANMVSEFGQRAIGIQSELAAQEAKNQYTQLAKSSGDAVFNDPSQRDQVQANLLAAVNDPKSIYSKLPAPQREKMLQDLQNQVDFATVTGITRKAPGTILSSVAPELQKQFDPWSKLMATYVAPGGKADISPATMTEAPSFVKAAGDKGLNPNILMAVADASPAPGKQTPDGLAKDMGVLVSQYGGDYTKAVAAYHMGTAALDPILKLNGSNWQAALPPEVQAFTNSVMVKSGSVPAPQVQPAPGAPGEPASATPAPTTRQPVKNSTLAAFNGLTWEQQDHAINEDVRMQHMVMTMGEHAREEQQRLQAKQQEATESGFITRVYDPSQGGPVSIHEVAQDPTLTGTQKSRIVGIMFAYQRELKNAAETKSNPYLFNKLGADMVAADNDPTRAPSMDDARTALANGQITMNDYIRLQSVYTGLKDSNGNSFTHQMAAAVQSSRSVLRNDPAFIMNPEGAEAASSRLQGDLMDAAEALRKKGENPRTLLVPGNPNYFFKPGVLESYKIGGSGALDAKAQAVVNQQTSKLPVGRDSVKSGELYRTPEGAVMRKR